MGRSLLLAFYLGLAHGAQPLARWMLDRRIARGEVDPAHRAERLGSPTLQRPTGRLVWIHASCIEEVSSLLELVDRLLSRHGDVHVLLTTAASIPSGQHSLQLPDRLVHQTAPVDTRRSVRAFLDHWRPDIAVWAETEFCPMLMHQTRRAKIPMLLINARISAATYNRLRWLGRFAGSLLERFDRILVQDDAVAGMLKNLGADAERLEVTGSLKDTSVALPHDANDLKSLMLALKGKQVWLAASTHPGEEEMVAAAHRFARRAFHGLVLILAPRDPGRGSGIAQMLREKGWSVACRSRGENLERDTEIYLADTVGEMGLWYRLAAVCFVGGSLVPVGGHNPFEPAQLGCAVLHGPHTEGFESAYRRLGRANGAVLVPDADKLGPNLVATLPADKTAELATNAWGISSESADVAERVLEVFDLYLPVSE